MKTINLKKKPVKFLFTIAAILFATVVFGQPSGGGGGQGQGGDPPSGEGAPIDGGAGMLLAGIAGYAHYRLKLKRTEKK